MGEIEKGGEKWRQPRVLSQCTAGASGRLGRRHPAPGACGVGVNVGTGCWLAGSVEADVSMQAAAFTTFLLRPARAWETGVSDFFRRRITEAPGACGLHCVIFVKQESCGFCRPDPAALWWKNSFWNTCLAVVLFTLTCFVVSSLLWPGLLEWGAKSMKASWECFEQMLVWKLSHANSQVENVRCVHVRMRTYVQTQPCISV